MGLHTFSIPVEMGLLSAAPCLLASDSSQTCHSVLCEWGKQEDMKSVGKKRLGAGEVRLLDAKNKEDKNSLCLRNIHHVPGAVQRASYMWSLT